MIPKDYTIADMADDQAKVLKTLGISDACVMGVSQGGMISMHLAAKYPELVTYTLGQLNGANNSNLPEGNTYEDNP